MSATAASLASITPRSPARATALAEHRPFVWMAALFVAVALVGFLPSSIGKVGAVAAGQRPPFLPVLHVHALSMGAWLLLLLVQASLAASGRSHLHRRLGLGSLALVPVMVGSGFLLVPATFQWVWAVVSAPPPGMPAAEAEFLRTLITNIPLAQLRSGILFVALVSVALLLRRRDPGTHRRLMILATANPLLAAVDRMAFLPSTLPSSALSLEIYGVLLILPMLVWDLARQRTLPRAYVIWFAASVPLAVAMHGLWGTAWWASVVPGLMGVS